jgi:HEAT repeat protein
MRHIGKALLPFLLLAAGCTRLGAVQRDLDSPKWGTRYAAAGKLQDLPPGDDAAALLCKAMSDPAPRVRRRASRSLIAFLGRDDGGRILDRLRGETDAAKLVAINAMIEVQTPDSAGPFLAEMLEHPSPEIRLAATRALRTSGDPKKVDALLAMWQDDDNENVRVAAIVSASYPVESARRNPAVIECYRRILANGPQLLRRPGILRAVGDLGIASAEPHLLRMIDDPELRYLSIEALGKIRSEQSVRRLLEILEKNESWVTNREVCRALGRIRARPSARALAKLFVEAEPQRDRDSWDRLVFITIAMAKIGGDEVFEAFASKITDKNFRDFALYGLARMTGARVVWSENRWLYTWKGIERLWRECWKEHSGEVAEKLEKEAEEERQGYGIYAGAASKE